jgi:hypothetical protein
MRIGLINPVLARTQAVRNVIATTVRHRPRLSNDLLDRDQKGSTCLNGQSSEKRTEKCTEKHFSSKCVKGKRFLTGILGSMPAASQSPKNDPERSGCHHRDR